MTKTLFRRLCLMVSVALMLYSCRTEEEAISSHTETGTISYGISEQAFLQSRFITGLNANKIANAKNTNTGISPEDLAQRLDLEKAHLSSYEGEEILHVPVRVFGTYKRSLLTISRNQSSNAYLLTYPDPADHKLFYITNLNGELLKEVRIGEDGKDRRRR